MGDTTGLIGQLQDVLVARRVFGEPVQVEGGTVIPVASVAGGGGGGGEGTEAGGAGGGFGARIAPVGVFAVRDGKVSWHPAVDVNQIVLGGQIVSIVALFILRTILRRRGRGAASGDRRR